MRPSDSQQPAYRPFGLSRRQSYDPLSSRPFSLGPLPAPQFGAQPAGATSVPAIELNRRLGGPSGVGRATGADDGGRTTPGGSMVIGAEVFGSGGKAAKPSRESWGPLAAAPEAVPRAGEEEVPPAKARQEQSQSSSSSAPRSGTRSYTSREVTALASEQAPRGMPSPQQDSPPSPRGGFGRAAHRSQPSRYDAPQQAHYGQASVDELAYGMSSMTFDGGQGRQYLPSDMGQVQRQGSYYVRDAGMSVASPNPGYYVQQPRSPYTQHEVYGGFFPGQNQGLAGVQYRRGSEQAWGLPFFMPPEFLAAAGGSSPAPSRHPSFSFSPGIPQHAAMGPFGVAPNQYGSGAPEPASPNYMSSGLPGQGAPTPTYLQRAGDPSGGSDYLAAVGGTLGLGLGYASYPTGRGRARDEAPRILRSPLLEEFRANRHQNWELHDIVGHVVEFSGDQLGSRHIQHKLETASATEKDVVFAEILPNLLVLSQDVFANYVIQKFLDQGSQAQKTAMVAVLEGHVLELSMQMYGCRVVQKALEHVLLDQQVRLIRELDGTVVDCAKDAQANHVLQRAVERIPSDYIAFIVDACIGHVYALATHAYGCRVIQRILENCPSAQSRPLLDELQDFVLPLIQDQYGNYVMQWIIERGEARDRSFIIANVHGNILLLSRQKFASNVVEKCIVYATEDERQALIAEVLTSSPTTGESLVKALLSDSYGNYPLQKFLTMSHGAQREELFAEASLQLANIRKYSVNQSKHLVSIEKLIAAERARSFHP